MDRELKARFDRHPYGALAAALGVGYLLGGGLFTPLTERIAKLAVRAGIRVALVPLLTARLSEFGQPAERTDQASKTPSAPPDEPA